MGGCCEHFEAILYGAYYIILLPKPHDNTHLHICKTSYRLVFLSVCLPAGLDRVDTHDHTAALREHEYVHMCCTRLRYRLSVILLARPRLVRVPQGSPSASPQRSA